MKKHLASILVLTTICSFTACTTPQETAYDWYKWAPASEPPEWYTPPAEKIISTFSVYYQLNGASSFFFMYPLDDRSVQLFPKFNDRETIVHFHEIEDAHGLNSKNPKQIFCEYAGRLGDLQTYKIGDDIFQYGSFYVEQARLFTGDDIVLPR